MTKVKKPRRDMNEVVPPFKRVRHLLRDAAIGLAWLHFDLGETLRVGWPTDGAGRAIIDATVPLDEKACPRDGTRKFLNLLRHRLLFALEQKQALAAASGRHWPLPSAIRFIIASDGTATAALRFPPPFQPQETPWSAATQFRVCRHAIRAHAVTGYSLSVVDVRDGSILLKLPSSKSWPACPPLSDIGAANPAWRGALSPQDATRLLREEIALLYCGDRSIVWRESIGEWIGAADEGFINWCEITEPVPTRIKIRGNLDGFGAINQYGEALVLAEDFADVPEIRGLQQEIVAWSMAYDTAFSWALDHTPRGTGGDWLGRIPLKWRRFNAAGLELARRLKALLGDRTVVVYEKASYDVTDRGDDAWIVE